MNAVEREGDLAPEQQRALAHPWDGEGLAIVGPPASGKTHVLLLRARDIAARAAAATIVTSASEAALARLRARIAARFEDAETLRCASLGVLAFEMLQAEHGTPGKRPFELVGDARAAQRFERVGAELFALDWTEFAAAEIDPEITGLRAPERFAATAYRLIRKLRASLVTPEAFRAQGLRGAADFYGHPPNFASADLLVETPPKYRDSLRVSSRDLEHQRAREIDLVKILSRLYLGYADDVVRSGELTAADAIYEATLALRARPEVRARARAQFGAILIDDAQELTDGAVAFLEAIFGEDLRGVTFAGDEYQRIGGFSGGARLAAFRRARVTIALDASERLPLAISSVARTALGSAGGTRPTPAPTFEGVTLYRAESQRDEARSVAGEIVRTLARGIAPERIAVVARNLGCVHPYIDALLARDVPVDPQGAESLYEFPAVLDALAALWAAVDPFRHDFLMRNLEAPWLRLADASIAALCADTVEAQPLLFELPGDPVDDAGPGWDRRRDLRLGRNVTRGDADAMLSPEARERVVRFRAQREGWERAARTLDLPALARLVLNASAFAAATGDARGRFERNLGLRLLEEIDAFAQREPLGTLDDFLAYAERRAGADRDLLAIEPRDPHAVRVCDAGALAGATFDAVFLVDVRAGAWPCYYVPDAFLFVPKLGMIPKDNVGDTHAARTAKFTWANGRYKFRNAYNDEDRRAFYLAATRARRSLSVTGWGRATRGKNTPELLCELEAARDLIRS